MEPRISIITLGVQNMERSYRFYHEGLGFPTRATASDSIVFFQTQGVCLALYPQDALAADIAPDFPKVRSRFSGITLAHNTRQKHQVDDILARAVEFGATLEKPAQTVSWGGYSGYFSDLDGYLWEIAWSEDWAFHADGSLVIE